MKIAVDAMGADHGPGVVVQGAVAAAGEYGLAIILVGDRDTVDKELAKHPIQGLSLEVVHAASVVEMDDSPVAALRQKPDSSIRIAINLVKEGRAAAVVSAGNTGAAMATTKVVWGAIKGVERPAIATTLPSRKGFSILLDAGANVDCKPFHLLQFAIMGSIYARQVMGVAEPRVGLLNIGAEKIKGNELTKAAYPLLEKADLNFIGNVEGRDVYNGRADVIVCDGFIGNVGLKISEGVAEIITDLLKKEIKGNRLAQAGALLMKPVWERLKKMTDYSEYGGAPLLGINGACIICHGGSNAQAIKNGIRVAHESLQHNLTGHIAQNIVERGTISRLLNNV